MCHFEFTTISPFYLRKIDAAGETRRPSYLPNALAAAGYSLVEYNIIETALCVRASRTKRDTISILHLLKESVCTHLRAKNGSYLCLFTNPAALSAPPKMASKISHFRARSLCDEKRTAGEARNLCKSMTQGARSSFADIV